ncbi:ATP synthase F0 subunit C [Candidatus Babeliales bacterium]|nr:ATP synthase F0 subunit C [Candidatus Babeliales bacterium]
MEPLGNAVDWVKVASYCAAGFCMGIGTIGPALGQGMIGAKACENLAKRPESANIISRTMMIAMVFVESAAIYALVIALLLVFK